VRELSRAPFFHGDATVTGAFTVNQTTIPHAGFLRIKGVLSKIPVSRATLYAGIKAGKYPKPIRLSEGVSVWRVADIDALCHQIEQQAMEVSK
jgi:predicted DNA-binding transcriptional regulator AlpA